MTILVTGAAGFIGSNFILNWLENNKEKVIALDKLTYAGNLENLKSAEQKENFLFLRGDIGDSKFVGQILHEYKPRGVINFAAESHVDRSIKAADDFIHTNILGTYHLLQEIRIYFSNLSKNKKIKFRFLHISTDEVFGSLSSSDEPFKETNQYKPNSPYSASKAASDHLVRSWHCTFHIPVITTNCSNNYGPYQFPEKLIPLCILNALQGKKLPIYGDGKQIRDWLHVIDHCKGIEKVLAKGEVGATYNIGGNNEKTNTQVVNHICELLDEIKPRKNGQSYKKQINYVKDRPGHDQRYAIDASKISNELDWRAAETFDSGIRKTVQWYLDNQDWVKNIVSGDYKNWALK